MSSKDESPWVGHLSLAFAVLLPLGLASSRVDASPVWREDLPLVRGLGLLGTVGEGGVSALLVQLATLLPIGSLPFRAAMVSAFALGACSLAVYELTKKLLSTNLPTPRLAPPLAAMTALLATLSPSLQNEAVVAGGASVAASLGAVSLLLALRTHATRLSLDAEAHDPKPFLALGATLAACLVENAPLGLGLASALGLSALITEPRPTKSQLLALSGSLAVTTLALLLPSLLRPLAFGNAHDLGRSLFSLDSAVADVSLSRPRALASWAGELGLLSLALAALGAALGLARRRLRGPVMALVLLISFDALLPKETEGLLSGDPLAALHAMALLALAVLMALGVQAGATKLLAQKTQMGAVASVLLVALQLSLVSMAAEAAFSSPRKPSKGAGAWTTQALERLPSRSALLLRSRAMAFRIMAAELTDGSRPDVLAIPAALLSDARLAKGLLDEEPALAAILRDLSIQGRPSEASLTLLADARPLLVELDPSWDARLVSHLVAERLWLRFLPQPFGRSDREQAFSAAEPRFQAVKEAVTSAGSLDPATSAVLAAQLRSQAASAGVMGDRDAAFALLERLAAFSEDDPFIAELSHRLGKDQGSVRLEGLLR